MTTMQDEEARKSFGESLDEIKSDVIRLAALVSEQIGRGTEALLDADLAKAEEVIGSSGPQAALAQSIESRTYELFARQQPIAVDLRTLLTVLRALQELELAGNLMVSIAKAARRAVPPRAPAQGARHPRADGHAGERPDAPRDRRVRRPRQRARALPPRHRRRLRRPSEGAVPLHLRGVHTG